ncbi:hypothetical protein, partial [Cupriavidus sp. 8B]
LACESSAIHATEPLHGLVLASATAGLLGLSPFSIARNIHHTDLRVMMTYNLFYVWNGTTMTYRIPHETKKVHATASMWTRRDKHWMRSDVMGKTEGAGSAVRAAMSTH